MKHGGGAPSASPGGDDVIVDVLAEIVIECPVESVAAYAADPSNAPNWLVNIQSVTWKTPRPLRVGSQVAFEAQFLGRRLEYTYEAIELIPGARLVMRSKEGPYPMETTYTWEPLRDGKTRMTIRNRAQPQGFSKVLGPLVAGAMRRANRNDLVRLKALLERA